MTNEQKQVFISGVLGDGSLHKTGKISYNCMYKEYMEYKKRLLGKMSSEVRHNENLGYKKGSDIFNIVVRVTPEGKDFYNLSLKEKIYGIDELGLALWFMDDASLHNKNLFYNINTHSFTREEEEEILIPKLNEFGIFPEILTETKKDGRTFTYLYVPKYKGAMEMSSIIEKYVVECYRYKLIPKEIVEAYHNSKNESGFMEADSNFRKTNYLKKKYNVKTLHHLVKNNIKDVEMTLDSLEKKWKNKFGDTACIYSAYTYTDDDKDIVKSNYNFMDENAILCCCFKAFFTFFLRRILN